MLSGLVTIRGRLEAESASGLVTNAYLEDHDQGVLSELMNRDFIKIFPVVFAVFLAFDAFWLAVVAPRFYQSQIGFLLRDTPNWPAAAAFYLVYIAGLTVFVVHPAVERRLPREAILRGALFGFVTYATYDLTNLATVEGWPVVVTVVDLAWGTTLCAATSLVSTWIFMGRTTTDAASKLA